MNLQLISYRRNADPARSNYVRVACLPVESRAAALELVPALLTPNQRKNPDRLDRIELRCGEDGPVLMSWARRPHRRHGWDMVA